MRRGRWATVASLRRYGKETRLLREAAKVDPDVLLFGEIVERNFLDALRGGPLLPLVWDELPASWRSCLFLELFAGQGRISKRIGDLGYGCLDLDLAHGACEDHLHTTFESVVRGWLLSKAIVGLWLETPCTSWSQALRDPLRSSRFPMGKPGLSGARLDRLRVGNRSFHFSCRLIRLCIQIGFPVFLENPRGSLLWHAPEMVKLLSDSSRTVHKMYMCRFGTPFKKPATVACWNAGVARELRAGSAEVVCHGVADLCKLTRPLDAPTRGWQGCECAERRCSETVGGGGAWVRVPRVGKDAALVLHRQPAGASAFGIIDHLVRTASWLDLDRCQLYREHAHAERNEGDGGQKPPSGPASWRVRRLLSRPCRRQRLPPGLRCSGAGARGAARGGGLAGLLERPPLPPAAEDAQVTVIDPSGVPVPGPGARFAALEEAPFPAGVVADLRAAGCGPPLPELLQLAWPLAASRVDAAVVADPQEGTALAFLPPAFAHIVEHHMTSRCPVLLVAAPTQERSMELDAFARKLGRASGIRTVCCHEGAALQVQARRISMGVHCVIGTPSRLWELLASGELSVAAVSTLVVDGADVALALGLEGHLLQIRVLQSLPEQRHSTVLTGSWSLPVLGLALLAARRPAQVHSGGWASLSADPDVAHVVRPCPEDGQVAALRDVLREAGVPFGGHHPRTALAFCLSDALGEEAARQATLGGAVCRRLPSGSGEHERAEALQSLRAGASQVLITTDMASLGPGADVSVALVVNVGVPATAQEYIHRACLAGAVDGPLEGGARQRGLIVTLAPEGGDGSLAAVAEVMRRMGQATPWDVESALRRAEAAAAAAGETAAAAGRGGEAQPLPRSRRTRR
ncbi:unnamed protein product [Prorocentrum cordatum]|uniref:RNA helicase n=1 Tax=Prorocentrum cordatum TaxID=2364126 RepID=A0ABN9VFV8_9DINO|nr:unnamed protein product [Polarella glacialis]